MSTSLSLLSLRLPRQTVRLPHRNVALGQPPARLDDLDDVDELLEEHDGETDASNDPRPEAVHLVGARQLERRGAVGARKDLPQQRLVHLCPCLDVIHDRGLQQGRGECGRGEGEQVERNEKGLVQGAADEQERLEVSRQRQV